MGLGLEGLEDQEVLELRILVGLALAATALRMPMDLEEVAQQAHKVLAELVQPQVELVLRTAMEQRAYPARGVSSTMKLSLWSCTNTSALWWDLLALSNCWRELGLLVQAVLAVS